jgi:hypothetical protein
MHWRWNYLPSSLQRPTGEKEKWCIAANNGPFLMILCPKESPDQAAFNAVPKNQRKFEFGFEICNFVRGNGWPRWTFPSAEGSVKENDWPRWTSLSIFRQEFVCFWQLVAKFSAVWIEMRVCCLAPLNSCFRVVDGSSCWFKEWVSMWHQEWGLYLGSSEWGERGELYRPMLISLKNGECCLL